MPTCRDFGCHGRDAVETFQAVVRREASQLGPRGYELTQIKASLEDATTLYPGIPTRNMDIVAKPLQSIGDAIEAKNSTMFAKAFGDLTTACNGCHQAKWARLHCRKSADRLPVQQPIVFADTKP